MLACCSSAALLQCLLHSHSHPCGGLPAAQASNPWLVAPGGRSLGPRITEKSIDFGLRQAQLLATLSLTWPHTGHRTGHRQAGYNRWIGAINIYLACHTTHP